MDRKRVYTEKNRSYAGCFFYESLKGDKTYYCQFRDEAGKLVTAKHGKKSQGKSLSSCSLYRSDLIQGKASTRQQDRKNKEKEQLKNIEHLYNNYCSFNSSGRDDSRFYKWVLPFWKDKDICKCTNKNTAEYRIWIENQLSNNNSKLSAQSVKHCIGLFRRIIRLALKHEIISVKITDFALPKVNNEKTEDMSPEQLKKYLHILLTDKVNRPVCDMLLIMINTGMRRGEVLNLQWRHVNVDRKTVLIKDPKGKIDITIPINEVVLKILNQQAVTSLYVFPGANGGRRLHIDKQARRIRDLAGLPKDFRPCHALRHYYGTELSARGVDITVISDLMGHKSVEMTRRYVKSRDIRKIEAVNVLTLGGCE